MGRDLPKSTSDAKGASATHLLTGVALAIMHAACIFAVVQGQGDSTISITESPHLLELPCPTVVKPAGSVEELYQREIPVRSSQALCSATALANTGSLQSLREGDSGSFVLDGWSFQALQLL